MGRLRGLLTMQAGFKVQLAGKIRGSVSRLTGYAYTFPSGGPPPAATVSGTVTGTWYESHVVSGVDTLILTLTGTQWPAAGATFDARRAEIRDSFVAATSPANGWNALRSTIPVTAVVRTSNQVCTITLPALGSYSIASNESILCTLPPAVTVAGVPIVATPVLTVIEGAPSALYPNKPSGYTASREIDFAMAVPTSYGADRSIPGSDNFHMIYDVDYGGGEQSIMRVADATAPSGDGYAWRWHFIPGTYGDGYGRGNIYTNLSSQNIRALYTCIDIKWASDYPWHAVSNKFLWWTPDQLLVQSQETVRWLHGEHLSGSQWLDNVIGPLNGATLVTYHNDAISRGVWHKIEVLLDRNAQTFRIWMDNDLKLYATGVTMTTNVFDEVFHTGHRGGGGETLSTDGYYYIDHLHYAWAP